ncbi:MAG: InlB B-repeat-containing protein [Christensenellaceae bacterium]
MGAIQYTVVFKESAEAADGIRIECLYDQWKSLPDLYIEKEGHHLSAWQQTGASGVILGLGDHIYNLTETDGAVLVFYPKMELNRYTLVFGREEVSLEYGQEFELPEPPAKTGYEFAGWSFDSWYATEEYASGSYRAGEIVKNVTLRHVGSTCEVDAPNLYPSAVRGRRQRQNPRRTGDLRRRSYASDRLDKRAAEFRIL